MISEREGDLLEQPDLTHIAHQANLYHTFGAGLALQIAKKFPRALAADMETSKGYLGKLGGYSVSTGNPIIFNVYSQKGFGKNATDYDAMRAALILVRGEVLEWKGLAPAKLGIPHGMGCGLAGGDWSKVKEIIREVFDDSWVEVVIVKLKEGK